LADDNVAFISDSAVMPSDRYSIADRLVRNEESRTLSGGFFGMDGRYGILKPTKA